MHLVKTILNDELFRKKIVQTNKDQEIYNSEMVMNISLEISLLRKMMD